MKRVLLSLLVFSAFTWARADNLGADVGVMPPSGWKSVEPFPPLLAPSPFATLKYVPADARHAAIIITLMPADVLGFSVRDFASLNQFTLIAAQPYLPAGAPAPRVIEHSLPAGLANCVTVTCPLKPAAAPGPAPYRMATTASLLLDANHLVHFTILHDEENVPEFRQAVEVIRTVHLREIHALAMSNREIMALARAEATIRP